MDSPEISEVEGLWVQCNNAKVHVTTEGCVTIDDITRKIITNHRICHDLKLESGIRRLHFFAIPGAHPLPESLPLVAVLGRIGTEDRPLFAKAKPFLDAHSKQF